MKRNSVLFIILLIFTQCASENTDKQVANPYQKNISRISDKANLKYEKIIDKPINIIYEVDENTVIFDIALRSEFGEKEWFYLFIPNLVYNNYEDLAGIGFDSLRFEVVNHKKESIASVRMAKSGVEQMMDSLRTEPDFMKNSDFIIFKFNPSDVTGVEHEFRFEKFDPTLTFSSVIHKLSGSNEHERLKAVSVLKYIRDLYKNYDLSKASEELTFRIEHLFQLIDQLLDLNKVTDKENLDNLIGWKK